MKRNFLVALTLTMMFVSTIISAQEFVEKEVADTVIIEKVIPETGIRERGFQISFLTPIGTNGTQSHLTINKVSLNVLGGYSYGNTGVEFGGLYNINTYFTKGVQFSGITNYSGNAYNATQISGIANIARQGTVSAQITSIYNMANDVKGAQVAIIANVANDVKGAQVANVVNVANNVKGAQIANVVNVANEVNGVQIANVVNIAKKVKGVQIGLINIAEESDGVSIGLINIVKNGGKYEFEVSVSDAINTSVSFRMGTNKFYTIFSGGINYLSITSPKVEYMAGVGIGTHIDWKNGWANQFELMNYTLTEGGKFRRGVNQLSQFKFIVSKEFAKHFKVFAGPVFNLTISDYVNPETGELGASLAPWSMWKNDSNRIRLNSWIGFTAGIRF